MDQPDTGAEPAPAAGLAARFARLPLTGQFLLAGGIVMLGALVVTASWVTDRIEASVVANTASATALYVDSFVAPLSQELASGRTLSDAARQALDGSFASSGFSDRIASIKIWKPDGFVAYATDAAVEGRRLSPPTELQTAWSGDHPIFRDGLLRSLDESGAFAVLGAGATADEAVALATAHRPALAILDISMPGGGSPLFSIA